MLRVFPLSILCLVACQPPQTIDPAGGPAQPVATAPGPATTSEQVTCGDGQVSGSEVCDGANLRGKTCENAGFGAGEISCASTCNKFDTSKCAPPPKCGDMKVDPGEQCESGLVAGKTCKDLGFKPGAIGCSADCKFDTSRCGAPLTCGNAKVEAGEVCDGGVGAQTCEGLGFGAGSLECGADCRAFNTADCGPGVSCGNGKIDAGEVCDGAALGANTCQSHGFGAGVVSCGFNCGFIDTHACPPAPAVCGNGKVEAGEECDIDSEPPTCESIGKVGGVFKCASTGPNKCHWDASICCAPDCGDRVCGADPVCGTDCGACNAQPECVGAACVCSWAGQCVNPCEGQTCSNHGTCQVQAGNAVCACAQGYTPGAGLTCVVAPPSAWTCSAAAYTDALCDCGCGVQDPACPSSLSSVCQSSHCGATQPNQTQNFLCQAPVVTTTTCKTMPSSWTCPTSYCGDGECDCGCGVLDSDCGGPASSACQWNNCSVGNPQTSQNWLCQ